MTKGINGTAFDLWTSGILSLNALTCHWPLNNLPEGDQLTWDKDILPLLLHCLETETFGEFMKAALPHVNVKEQEIIEALHFVLYVLNPDPLERPTVDEVMRHPFLKSEQRLEGGDVTEEDIPQPRVFKYAGNGLPTAKDLEELEEQSAQWQGAWCRYDKPSSPEVLWIVENRRILSEKDPMERSNAYDHRSDVEDRAKGGCQPKGPKLLFKDSEDPASKGVMEVDSTGPTDSAFFEVQEGGWTEIWETPSIRSSDLERDTCSVQDHTNPSSPEVLWIVEDRRILSEKDPTERSNASEHRALARNEHRGDVEDRAKGDCQPKGPKLLFKDSEDLASKGVMEVDITGPTDSAFFEVQEGGWTEIWETPSIRYSDLERDMCSVQDHTNPAPKQDKKKGKGIRGWFRKKFGKLFGKKKPKT